MKRDEDLKYTESSKTRRLLQNEVSLKVGGCVENETSKSKVTKFSDLNQSHYRHQLMCVITSHCTCKQACKVNVVF